MRLTVDIQGKVVIFSLHRFLISYNPKKHYYCVSLYVFSNSFENGTCTFCINLRDPVNGCYNVCHNNTMAAINIIRYQSKSSIHLSLDTLALKAN